MNLDDGIPIIVSRDLVGARKALQVGNGPIYVSPAMYSLMQGATSDELRHLLANLHVIRIPAFDPAASLPFITSPRDNHGTS